MIGTIFTLCLYKNKLYGFCASECAKKSKENIKIVGVGLRERSYDGRLTVTASGFQRVR